MSDDVFDIEHEVYLALTYITGEGIEHDKDRIVSAVKFADDTQREKRARLAVVRVLKSDRAPILHGALSRAFADVLTEGEQDSLKIYLRRRATGRPTNERVARSIAERVMDRLASEYERRLDKGWRGDRAVSDQSVKAACLEVAEIAKVTPVTVQNHFKRFRDKIEMERGFYNVDVWRKRHAHIRDKKLSAKQKAGDGPEKTK